MKRSLFLLLAVLLAAATAFATQPQGDLPPGSSLDDPSPSDVIFPQQDITIHFDHKLHVTGLHQACTSCHAAARTSDSVGDSLIPPGTQCDACHHTDHSDLRAVKGENDGRAA